MDHSVEKPKMNASRLKFIIGGFLIIAAVIYLIISSTQANAQYFLTVEEVLDKNTTIIDRNLRISGAVIGDTIVYDPNTLTLTFNMAHIPGDNKEISAQGGLAAVLNAAVNDPNRKTIGVIYNGPIPDLLKNEAQAIVTGRLGQDGFFYADELLLKCPTRYDDTLGSQTDS